MIPSDLLLPHPPGPRPLLDAAWRMTDGTWEQGVDAQIADCLYGVSVVPCPPADSALDVTFQSVGAVVYIPSAGQIRLKCSSLSRGDQSPLAVAVWQRHLDYMIAADLANSIDNPNLVDSPVIAAPTTIAAAFACLENHAATTLKGGPAFIHIPPEQAAALGMAAQVYQIGDGLYTAAGTRVIADPAYAGLDAAFVTGPVRVGYHDTPEVQQTLDSTDNTVYLTAWGPIIAVIDVCATARVTLPAIVCTPPV